MIAVIEFCAGNPNIVECSPTRSTWLKSIGQGRRNVLDVDNLESACAQIGSPLTRQRTPGTVLR
jgi:hypothetical protein